MFECPKHRTLPLINSLITFANLMSELLASKKVSLKPANSSVTLTKMLTDGKVLAILNNSPQYLCHPSEVSFTESSTRIVILSQTFTASE